MSIAHRSLYLAYLAASLAAGCVSGERRPTAAPAPGTPTEKQVPFFDARSHTAEYAGPGREIPPPEDLEEVRIGYFGPADPQHPTAGLMWQAATLAIEEANQAGGYEGLPFCLLTSWSENPWGSGIEGVTRLIYAEGVWAIVGAPDGPSAHLAAQVVAKARLAFLSPVSTDKTTNLANVPWIFSCAPGDHILAPLLAEALTERAQGAPFALASCTDHDSRVFTTELRVTLKRLKAFPADHVQFQPGETDFSTPLRSLRQTRPAAVALIAGTKDSARFLTVLRREGLTMPVFGGPTIGRRSFVESAGECAEGVVFPLLWNASAIGEPATTFARRFEQRFGVEPDDTAAYTYDAMNLLIAAIRTAGLNRVRIRDAVRCVGWVESATGGRNPPHNENGGLRCAPPTLQGWPGVSGPIIWDPTGQNERPVGLGIIRSGRVERKVDEAERNPPHPTP
ncbi:MAG: ABC transporter substrate-binding protein [Planctomycetota bacterium]